MNKVTGVKAVAIAVAVSVLGVSQAGAGEDRADVIARIRAVNPVAADSMEQETVGREMTKKERRALRESTARIERSIARRR